MASNIQENKLIEILEKYKAVEKNNGKTRKITIGYQSTNKDIPKENKQQLSVNNLYCIKQQIRIAEDKFQRIKRTTLQEQLFKKQCQMQQQITKDLNNSKFQNNNCPINNIKSLNNFGKNTLKSSKEHNLMNEVSKIENWSVSYSNKEFKNKIVVNKSIEKIAVEKDEANQEFLNFVKNTTYNKSIFSVDSNISYNKNIDFSLLKIIKIVNKEREKNVLLVKNIKEKFVQKSTNSIINSVDFEAEQIGKLKDLGIDDKSTDNKYTMNGNNDNSNYGQNYYMKLKQLQETSLNSSLDSDDFSNASTSMSDLSVLRGFGSLNHINRTSESKKKEEIISSDLNSSVSLKSSNSTDDITIPTKTISPKNNIKPNKQIEIQVHDDLEENRYIFFRHSSISEINCAAEKSDLTVKKKSSENSINELKCLPKPDCISNYDEIAFDDEFDCVNFQNFIPYTDLLNRLITVKNAVAIEMTNSNIKNTIKEKNKDEVNLPILENISSQSESLELPNKKISVNTKASICKNIQNEDTQGYEYSLNNFDKALESCTSTTMKGRVSSRMKKKKSALKNYHKNLNHNNIGIESSIQKMQQDHLQQHQEEDKSIDRQNGESLIAKKLILKHSILHEIMKKNLHLNCKPIFKS